MDNMGILDFLVRKDRRAARNDEEHRLQAACVKWFRYTHRNMSHSLFAVPNGGRRDPVTGAKMKDEGALAGVSDLIFLQRNRCFGALLIEMKTDKGRLSTSQKEWGRRVSEDGYRYVVCRSLDEFKDAVEDYISLMEPEREEAEDGR